MSKIYVTKGIREEIKDLYDDLEKCTRKLWIIALKVQGINPDSPTPEDEKWALGLLKKLDNHGVLGKNVNKEGSESQP